MRRLTDAFQRWRERAAPMTLATVVHTEGSTYAKAGTFMLFASDGSFEGLLSGGCLEPDLGAHAKACADSAEAQLVTYDMRERGSDELWGLGLGCDGMMQVLLRPLLPAEDFQPFARIAAAVAAHQHGTLILSCAGPTLGAAAFSTRAGVEDFGLGTAVAAEAAGGAPADCAKRIRCRLGDGEYDLLCVPIALPLRLLILGAGPDAVPVLQQASALGWSVTVADHRPGYLAQPGFAGADARVEVDPATAAATLLHNEAFDAAVIMSHHLASDRAYLAALVASDLPYVGLLGPPERKARLVEDLRIDAGAALRLHGPVGLDIGARGPEAIALSIVAEIYAECAGVD